MLRGLGKMWVWDVETPALSRYGQLTHDEVFASENATLEGVDNSNPYASNPLVLLNL